MLLLADKEASFHSVVFDSETSSNGHMWLFKNFFSTQLLWALTHELSEM